MPCGIVGILLAVLEHLVLRLFLPLQVFLHGLLLLALSFALRATLGIDRVIRLCSRWYGEAEAGNCQAKKDDQSFHEFSANRLVRLILPQSWPSPVGR